MHKFSYVLLVWIFHFFFSSFFFFCLRTTSVFNQSFSQRLNDVKTKRGLNLICASRASASFVSLMINIYMYKIHASQVPIRLLYEKFHNNAKFLFVFIKKKYNRRKNYITFRNFFFFFHLVKKAKVNLILVLILYFLFTQEHF